MGSQQNDYDAWGVALTGLNRASRFVNANFHTFNGQEQLEFGYQNMGWRWMDNLTGRMSGIDSMHQFDSDYTALGNQPTMRIDPDGQFAPLIVYGVAALVGGGINLASNWSKVKDWKSGGAYFLSGAVGGVVAVTNPFAGGAITSTSNAVIDIATGNLPNLQSPSDYATYLGKEALIGGVSSYAGAQIGKLVGPQLGKVFHWSQQTFANATQQTIQIGGQSYSYAVDAGVKLSKSWVGAAGSSLSRAALPAPKTIARHHVFPDKFRPWFKQQGIANIDDYTIEMEHWTTHLKGVHGKGLSQFNLPGKWNARWADFIKANPNANQSQIFKFGEDLMSEYGFRFSKFVKYR